MGTNFSAAKGDKKMLKKTTLLLVLSLFFASGLFSEELPAVNKGFWVINRSAMPEPATAAEENALRWRTVSLWKPDGMKDLGVSNGIWKLKATRGNPHIYPPKTKIDAENQPIASFRMKLGKGMASKGCILFTTESLPNYSDDRLISFDCAYDGDFHDYEVDMSKHPLWKGKVTNLRFQPFYFGDKDLTEENSVVEIEYFRFPDLS